MIFVLFFNLCFAEVPRFVSLRASKVNTHVGPGKHYPVSWQYCCIHLPVEIIAEFEDWRLVRDQEKITGWVHRSLLTGRRFARIVHSQMIYAKPHKSILAYVYKGMIGKILSCNDVWCYLEFSYKSKKLRGWVKRKNLWGLYKEEVF